MCFLNLRYRPCGGVCNRHREDETYIVVEYLKERNYVSCSRQDEKVMLKWILETHTVRINGIHLALSRVERGADRSGRGL
jgi:hypothetical protein